MMMTTPAVQRRRSTTRALEAKTGALFAECAEAFHAICELDELAENLRILSLNAELAAGRAGDQGRAVRALTQYTRELVNRLTHIQTEMINLRTRTYNISAACLRDLQYLGLLEAIPAPVPPQAQRAQESLLAVLEKNLKAMTVCVAELSSRTKVVVEVVNQSDSIATNIAIEAAAAGAFETEFRTVSDTMRRYIEELRVMLDRATDSVRRALDGGQALKLGKLSPNSRTSP